MQRIDKLLGEAVDQCIQPAQRSHQRWSQAGVDGHACHAIRLPAVEHLVHLAGEPRYLSDGGERRRVEEQRSGRVELDQFPEAESSGSSGFTSDCPSSRSPSSWRMRFRLFSAVRRLAATSSAIAASTARSFCSAAGGARTRLAPMPARTLRGRRRRRSAPCQSPSETQRSMRALALRERRQHYVLQTGHFG